jgi:hypothetical protein
MIEYTIEYDGVLYHSAEDWLLTLPHKSNSIKTSKLCRQQIHSNILLNAVCDPPVRHNHLT